MSRERKQRKAREQGLNNLEKEIEQADRQQTTPIPNPAPAEVEEPLEPTAHKEVQQITESSRDNAMLNQLEIRTGKQANLQGLKTWEGLETIGHLGNWKDMPAKADDSYKP